MLLKKQTVWLLTMLSLVVVLSVYYITSPEQKANDLTAVEQKGQKQTKTKPEAKDGKTVVSTVAGDVAFEELRMQLEESRSKQREELTETMGTTSLPADDRLKAKDEIDRLRDISQKEEYLETMIKAMGYEDALVRADGEKVSVTVKSKKKHTKAEANKIILEVKKEISDSNFVAVTFQPAK
ncbi:SpoIIIAH-like family protein [Bacillus sp. FJAT-29814]|uniref:SpoIIIAH-like family protein n=1 Tax=Bacillus sp. FJAT-29814 TaxID=1729688 RepID=UPI00083609F4|nr:SpoIIIAH-like family protein [Bacillus sp. FJAT-29814]